MFEMSQSDLMAAYAEARNARVPITEMGCVERGGYYLILSAGATKDGEPVLGDAIGRALFAGAVDVAVELGDRFMPEVDVEVPRPRRGNGNFEVSGELHGS